MAIQINGQTDIISAVDGALNVQGADLSNISNLNVSGIVTASGITVAGIVTANSTGINVTGIVTATSFVGDGTNLTGVFQGVNGKRYIASGTFVVGTDCPSTVTQIKIMCMGGGANGGLYAPDPAGDLYGGGGGGASVLGIAYRTVSNGQSYTVTVGGVAGISSVVLPTGPTTVISVPGGSTGGNAPTGGAGGAGGARAPITPTGATYVQLTGDNITFGSAPATGPSGSATISVARAGNGGGGSAWYPGAPNTALSALGGAGGHSVFGIGGGQNTAGSGYGAGGGGRNGPGAALAGTPGIVIIEW